MFHSENGILGMGGAPGPGEEDPDLINAGKGLTTLVPGGVVFPSQRRVRDDPRRPYRPLGHGRVRGVARRGDLANWTTDDPTFAPGVGGAMDLAAGARRCARSLSTRPRTASRASASAAPIRYAPACVSRVYTNLAVLDITREGVVVREMVEGLDLAALQALTEPKLILANDWTRLVAPEV